MFNRFLLELRLSWRSLLHQPGFFAVAVLTLALGVASVSAIFSVVNGTLLTPLPYPEAERIVRLTRVQDNWSGPVSAPLLADWRAAAGEQLTALAGFTGDTVSLTGEGEPERLGAQRVTPEFWTVMGLAPLHGRYFGGEEEQALERVVVISHGFWQRRYGGDPAVIGRELRLNGAAWKVVAIAPPSFRFPADSEVYLPTHLGASEQRRGSNYLMVVGRLAEGASEAGLGAALDAGNAQLREQFPAEHANLSVRIRQLTEQLNSGVREPLLILLAASGLVLLIACANLSSLLLARGNSRHRELAVRAALGAGRHQLLRLVLLEAAVLAVVGAGLGLILAANAVPALLALMPDVLPNHARPGLDLRAMALCLLICIGCVLLFALWPALRLAKVDAGAVLKEEGRGGGRRRLRAHASLVALEVALSLSLLVGAGLLIESLRRLDQIDLGLDPEPVLTAWVTLEGAPPQPGETIEQNYYRTTDVLAPKMDALLQRIAAIPGVQAVGMSDALPLSGINNTSSEIGIVGRDPVAGESPPGANWRFVSPDLFAALGMRVTEGRALNAADRRPGSSPVSVLVNQSFVRRYLGDRSPLGVQVQFFGNEPQTIVGVVADTRLFGVDRNPVAEVYLPHTHAFQTQMQLAIKVQGEPMSYAEQLRAAVREVDSEVPLIGVRSMREMIGRSTQLRQFNMRLMGVFSAVALSLAALGLYGVIAYSVSERRQEFGVRMSLGAKASDVLRLVLGQGMRMVGIGLLLGLIGALALGRALSSQLYGVSGHDPNILILVSLAMLLTGMLACLVPAYRATRVDPVSALRSL